MADLYTSNSSEYASAVSRRRKEFEDMIIAGYSRGKGKAYDPIQIPLDIGRKYLGKS